ncbi:DEKNAAC101764 [Brettanomyces naardenensis]|uniref:Glutamate--cysteine ligase n=1 Tax=Brettanomyces naardenensis TaxID=13370 RepID=A0A448YIL7_BRENA|nr:DEKNAAC101764 [Brettanomyces naardenensis]
MGLLSQGTPLAWPESRKLNEHVRDNGVLQLISCYNAAKERANDPFLWGDEIEYQMIRIDDEKKIAQLALDESEVLINLGAEGKDHLRAVKNDVLFHPEYGRFMLEATPLRPYDGRKLSDYIYVEKNMAIRRDVARKEMTDREVYPVTMTAFPTMGCPNFTYPEAEPNGRASQSLFLPDEIINKHVRFPTLTANIRKRRGQKVDINVPLYRDEYTDMDHLDSTIPKRDLFPSDKEPFQGAAKPGYIYMDSMGFGMGCCCLQVTMQPPDIYQARYVYDAFVNIAPALLSLTSATPFFRGHLADQDVRWNVISGAVDDRTPVERGVPALEGHNPRGGAADDVKLQRIPKSRYDSVDQYLGDLQPSHVNGSANGHANGHANGFSKELPDGTAINESPEIYHYYDPSLNDMKTPINKKVYKELRKNGFDHQLATHFAHLYVRDPLVIFTEKIDQDNGAETDHFENIQSTNWQTLRFKPPIQEAVPGNNNTPGWRVEIRPMEISITDFENAAYSVFTMLLARAVLKYKPNTYISMSKVEQNMEVAHQRDSTTNGKFVFRVNSFHGQDQPGQYVELSLDQIFNGYDGFEGLIPVTRQYVSETFPATTEKDKEDLDKIDAYFKLVSERASGRIPSTAKYLRDFALSHPDYKHDSIVSDRMNYDIVKLMARLDNYDHKLLPKFFGDELSDWLVKHGY